MRHVGFVSDEGYVNYYLNHVGVDRVCFVSTVGIEDYQRRRYFESDVTEMADQILAEHLGLTEKGVDDEYLQ